MIWLSATISTRSTYPLTVTVRKAQRGPAAWNTVTVAVEGRRLILVHLTRLEHTDIEDARGKRQSRSLVLLEADADWHHIVTASPLASRQRAVAEMPVQFGAVGNAWNRCGPLSLQIEDTLLDAGLLCRCRRQAELGRERIVGC